jgi:hypothetical protein
MGTKRGKNEGCPVVEGVTRVLILHDFGHGRHEEDGHGLSKCTKPPGNAPGGFDCNGLEGLRPLRGTFEQARGASA